MKKVFTIGLILGLVGCSANPVKPVGSEYKQGLKQICIERNHKVTIPSFENDLTRAFSERNIKTIYFDGNTPISCENKLNYSALRSWDMGVYISKINLDLYDSNGKSIGQVDWEQNPLALNKWKDTGKVARAVDMLLGEYSK